MTREQCQFEMGKKEEKQNKTMRDHFSVSHVIKYSQPCLFKLNTTMKTELYQSCYGSYDMPTVF